MRRSSVMHALRRLRAVQEDTARLKLTDQKSAYDAAADILEREKYLVEAEKSTEDVAAYVAWLASARLSATENRLALMSETAQLIAARIAMAHARSAHKMIEDFCAATRLKERAALRAREQLIIDDLANTKKSFVRDLQWQMNEGADSVLDSYHSPRIWQ